MVIKKIVSLSDAQRFLLGLSVIFSTAALLAVPYTLFQYFDLQYRVQYQAELRYTTGSYLHTSDGSRIQTYAYRDSPWAFASKISGYAFLLIPPFTTIIVSLVYLLTSKQCTSRSLFHALCLSALFFPINVIANLPWTIIYWDGWEWYVGGLLLLAEGAIIVFLSAIVLSFLDVKKK